MALRRLKAAAKMRRPVERLRTVVGCHSAVCAKVADALVRLQRFNQRLSIFLNTMNSADLQAGYEFGPFRLEKARRRLLCHGEVIQLRPKAIETLLLLIEQRDRIVEKEELLA